MIKRKIKKHIKGLIICGVFALLSLAAAILGVCMSNSTNTDIDKIGTVIMFVGILGYMIALGIGIAIVEGDSDE